MINNKDSQVYSVVKRAERIAAALYLITGLLSDSEPLKREIRERAVKLIAGISLAVDTSGPSVFLSKKSIGQEVLSLLEMGRLSGVVSQMNFDVLHREISSFVSLCQSCAQSGATLEPFSLGGGYFNDPSLDTRSYMSLDRGAAQLGSSSSQDQTQEKTNEMIFQKDNFVHQKDKRNEQVGASTTQPRVPMQTRVPGHETSSDLGSHPSIIAAEEHKRQIAVSSQPLVSERKRRSRRDWIIKALKKKGNLTIKDITRVVPGCSEKTVQRELIALIKDNVVSREGERRWSRYSLVAESALGGQGASNS